ncbi:MAG: hypothetical protein ABI222_05475 [Opitutaceae bacterium]
MKSIPLPRIPHLLLGLGAALLALHLSAQPGPYPQLGPAGSPPGRVLLFPEPNYRGDPLIVEAGGALENLEYVRDRDGRRWNDRISSVRIEGPVLLIMYEDAGYRGGQATLTRNAADLGALSLGDRRGTTWSRRISSLRVEVLPDNNLGFIRWERRDATRAVRSAYHDILGREPDDRGMDEYRDRLIDRGWTEDQLRDNLRRSPEFRNRDVSGIIRKGYRDILRRDPDSEGSARYTRSLHEGMSEAEFRADLKRSREYLNLSAKESVTRAYRDILRRDPDPAGLANYMKQMVERGWDENRVRDALRQSDEYRKLPRR